MYSLTTKESMAKHNMIVKFASIPFYFLGTVAIFHFCVNLFNSDKVLALLLVPLAIMSMYSIMFRSTLPNAVYFIKSYIKKSLKVSPWAVIALLISFIFGLDTLSGIILFKHELNQRPDILAKINAKKLKKVEEWKNKKHASILSFKIAYIIMTLAISIATIIIATMIIVESKNIIDKGESIASLFNLNLFIASLVVICIFSFLKFILSIIYGKRGEDNPIRFLFVMKIVDIIPSLVLLGIAFYLILVGTALGILSILVSFMLLPFLVFSIAIIIGLTIGGPLATIASYALSLPFTTSALLCIWSSSLSIFTYYINQRAMKNRRFASATIIICLIGLWIPVVDIAAMAILKNKEKNNNVLSEKPVIVME